MGQPKYVHPRPDFERKNWCNLNGEWDFRLFTLEEDEQEACFDRNSYTDRINVPFSWGAPLSGIGHDIPGTGWYRRKAEFDFDGRLFLVVSAADYECDIYVNGSRCVSHKGGYTPFEADVTELWQKGAANTIEIRVRDEQKNTQMYGKQGYGNILGLWQTVYLEQRPDSYITSFRIVPHTDGRVEFCVYAANAEGQTVSADFEGITSKGTVKGGKATFCIDVAQPELWFPSSPRLYYGTLCLGTDTVHTYFGIREVGTCVPEGRAFPCISLNGEPIYLNGTLDQSYNSQGFFTYPSDEWIRDEVWRMKRLGLNAVRIHIKCEEPLKLYECDRQGILVFGDVPNFWGEPVPEAKQAYEAAWREYFQRDFNHPCILTWVMFNETWGLFHKDPDGTKHYLPETQEWVRKVYSEAKAFDPTRLIIENSPCCRDHVVTDINDWHFYIHGYERLKKHLNDEDEHAYPGSSWNCAPGCVQGSVPLLNSECGMVWGVKGSAGDSDIAWQYHYMLNEFRLHEKLCGFVFTEFRDVVNEFNGYYRIDNSAKDFGYDYFCRGMQISDLHCADFIAVALPPCLKVSAGARVDVPTVLSSRQSKYTANGLILDWELWYDGIDGRVSCSSGSQRILSFGWGNTALKPIRLELPQENAVCILSLYLKDTDGNLISRNFTTFDVCSDYPNNITEVFPEDACTEGFDRVWTAFRGNKLCMSGKGEVYFDVEVHGELPGRLRLALEAGSKRRLTKDSDNAESENGEGCDLMLGYRVDRGKYASSYLMTDETRCPSKLTICIDDTPILQRTLANDWADARGILSWAAQKDSDDPLEEAGSYGEMIIAEIPSSLLPEIYRKGEFRITLKADNGLALYWRDCGKYALPMCIIRN